MKIKLVRDRIPEEIEKEGRKVETIILNDSEYKNALVEKLQEETAEAVHAVNTGSNVAEELADVLEVLHALAAAHNITINEIENIRKKKKQERGGFEKKILLMQKE